MAGKSFIFRFSDVEVREREFSLTKAGERLAVEPKAFRVLLILLRNPKKLIPKEELLNAVWGDTAVIENSLARAVALLRKALGDEARTPRFIETVATVGYRFIGAVEQSEDGDSVSTSEVPHPSKLSKEPQVLTGTSAQTRPEGRTILLWVGLAFMAIVVSGAVWRFLRPLPPPRITAFNQLTHDGHQKGLAGTDGSRIFFDMWSPNFIAQMSVTGGEISRISVPVPGTVVGPIDVSPDGSSFLVASGDQGGWDTVWNVRILGGAALLLAHNSRSAIFSPDGNWVAYAVFNDGIYVTRSNGTETRKVTGYPEFSPASFSWSPDGKSIQFELGGKLWEVSAAGGAAHPFLHGWQAPDDLCCGHWTADGNFFLFMVAGSGPAADQIWALDERRRLFHRTDLRPVQLTSPPLHWTRIVAGRDPKKLFAVGSTLRGELTSYDPGTKAFNPILGGISAEFPAYSPDGKSVVYVTYPEGILWKANRDGSSPLQLTEAGIHPLSPRWSPDGTQIGFNSEQSIGYIVSAAGGSPRRLLPEGSGNQHDLNWSPDGKKVLFGSESSGKQNLAIFDVAGGSVAMVPKSDDLYSPRWSRDGRSIAALAKAAPFLRFFDLQTGQWRSLPVQGDVDFPSFSRDGQSIYFLQRGATGQGIYRIQVNGGEPEPVVDLKDMHLTGYFGIWAGLDDSDSPLLFRDIGSTDIYALTLEQ